ncbi:MAG: hypothetical protein OHK0029_07040 [Armatimonadaceae bacterium]
MKNVFRGLAFLSACLLTGIAGCARVPGGGDTEGGKLLEVTVRFRGPVDINRIPRGNYYFVLINRTDNQGDAGPVPVVSLPWGNGFAAPSQPDSQGFVGFVRFDREQGATGYGVYSTEVNGVLLNPVEGIFTNLGAPDAVLVQPGPNQASDTLSFRLDLRRLPNPDARWVQLNILSTNNIPQGADDAPKVWDALGNGAVGGFINGFVVLDTTQNRILRNDDLVGDAQEPEGDVRDHLGPLVNDPSLDIVDWQIRILDR